MMINSADRAIVFKSSLIPIKTTRTAGGVSLMTLKKDQRVTGASLLADKQDDKGYRKLKLPATGTLLADKDIKNMQLKFDTEEE
jgi:DNA gyrase subunit A